MNRTHALWGRVLLGLLLCVMGAAAMAWSQARLSTTLAGAAVTLVGFTVLARGIKHHAGRQETGHWPTAGDARDRVTTSWPTALQSATPRPALAAPAPPAEPAAMQTITEPTSSTLPQPAVMPSADVSRPKPTPLRNESARLMNGGDFLAPTLGELSAAFLRWAERGWSSEQLWPAFDRWLRDTLAQFVSARRVRAYRVQDAGRRLVSLTGDAEHEFGPEHPWPALLQHVVTTGRRYLRGSAATGELIEQMARDWEQAAKASVRDAAVPDVHSVLPPPAWLLPIRSEHETVGVLMVGELPAELLRDLPTMQALGHLVELFWRQAALADALHTARRTDRVSGLLNRVELAGVAQSVLRQSAADGEPAVLLVLAMEGLRRLDDHGRLNERDGLIQAVSAAMRARLRSDDHVGRFSDDRFVAVLRRLDVTLGAMIARQMLAAVRAATHEQGDTSDQIGLRCGLCEAGADDYETALGRALEALHQGRLARAEVTLAPSTGMAAARGTGEVPA